MDELSDKQKEQIKLLKREASKLGAKIGFIGGVRIVAMCSVVILLNQLFVHSDVFVTLMAFVSGVLGMRMMRHDMLDTNEVLKKKTEDILENK